MNYHLRPDVGAPDFVLGVFDGVFKETLSGWMEKSHLQVLQFPAQRDFVSAA